MCVYCFVGDSWFRHDPPWRRQDFEKAPWDLIPQPVSPAPAIPWDLAKLKDYEEILKRIKALEDALGCPCESNKADYIGLFKERIEALEKKVAEQKS